MMCDTSMLPQKLAFVDIETTGMSPVYDRIIDIGIIRVENSTVVEQYNQLVNPHIPFSPFIQSMTGITPEYLEDAPAFEDIYPTIYELLKDTVFVAHNVRFDYGFLRNEFKRFDISFSSKQLCTAKLSRRLYSRYRRHNLSALINRFGFTCEHRHRAFDDAQVLWQFYQKIMHEFPPEKITVAIDHIQKRPTIPNQLDPGVVDTLPETSGIYFFYDKEENLLYIGKSNNIRSRVLSHLSSDYQSGKQMQMVKHIARIDFEVTAGELGALIRESYLVKKLNPIYNRQLRRNRKLIILKKITTDSGYDSAVLETLTHIDPDDINHIIGIFPSLRRAKNFLVYLREKYSLCEKILGMDASKGSCFSYHLGECRGACIGVEPARKYNARFLLAFAENRIKPWYFDAPIKIVEKNDNEELVETFIVDKWCLIRQMVSNRQQSSIPLEPVFDMDMYKILTRRLPHLSYGLHRT
ncbi:MAG: polymerase III, epsilon subunit protein [Candidatus Roizmanbacteria bacterium GW2011_GWB1_40_7]|uniref:Polymerase III, epsilon subunit protein n=3 Tax=Candidatus Roizmaniibacteriota TaxID=1752723 RepID=A0A0G0TAE2_9BACT|nr:MAG: polymerase III, epsilon subunit protein [Candidatus Roizmanbacteria bacterium GW2011_GWB1_40_7]KKR94083.1 MAG: polymerase III, epsilon subunit protein [Candidatus Roizmanbacteria bacterium GW2011_GWA1_41_13]